VRATLQLAALGIVSRFEGSANGAINTYDGQLLSVGCLQYALLAGSGVTFLTRIGQLDPAGFTAILGADFLAATRGGRGALLSFVQSRVTTPCNSSRALLAQWQARFTRLSSTAAYKQADTECARPYFDTAARICLHYKLSSERAYAWAFDRAVQQGGSYRDGVEAANAQLDLVHPDAAEWLRLKTLGNAYADSANSKYRENVRARTLAMALGGSAQAGAKPNGLAFDMAALGISPTVPWQ
jgi:hypothetical protein